MEENKQKQNDKVVTGNQYVADPRQSAFLSFYHDPQSPTFGNALKSALRAGYSKDHARNITHRSGKWLREFDGRLKKNRMLKLAEKNIWYFLTLDTINTGVTKKGDEFQFNDPRLERIKADVSKFVLERIAKEEWGPSVKLSDDGGKPLLGIQFVVVNSREDADKLSKSTAILDVPGDASVSSQLPSDQPHSS